jgi:outer membrane protein assembly factor BamB
MKYLTNEIITDAHLIFVISSDFIFYQKKNDKRYQLIFNTNVANTIFESDSYFDYALLTGSTLLLRSNNGDGYIFDINNKAIKKIGIELIVPQVRSSIFLCYFEGGIFTRLYGVFNLIENKSVYKSADFRGRIILDDKFVIGETPENKIVCYALNNDNVTMLWDFDIQSLKKYIDGYDEPHNSELVSVIGTYTDQIWLHVKDRRLVALDVSTGNLQYEILLYEALGIPQHHPATNTLIYGDMHLDKINGKIKSLSWRYYWELDLISLTATIKKDFGSDYNNTWRITKSKFYEGDKNLYFIGTTKGETFSKAVGVFDTEACEVVWYDEPLSESPSIFFSNVPQCSDKHLGVLDTGGTLRIYDRFE